MKTSLIIAVHNEGSLLAPTIASARETLPGVEVVVVDDAGTDGSVGPELDADRVIRHDKRLGVAQSRRDGGDSCGTSNVLLFCDGHHTFDAGCLQRTVDAAAKYNAIVWPCLRSLNESNSAGKWSGANGHGSYMAMQEPGSKRGAFGVAWLADSPRDELSRAGGCFVPYAMPQGLWQAVRWPDDCISMGFTETNLVLKAWFSETPVFHLCGAFSQHLFRRVAPYPNDSRHQWMNHAIGCRVCFTDETWDNYLFPEVFKRVFPTDIFSTPARIEEGTRWREQYKKRPDDQWWSCLMGVDAPKGVSKRVT